MSMRTDRLPEPAVDWIVAAFKLGYGLAIERFWEAYSTYELAQGRKPSQRLGTAVAQNQDVLERGLDGEEMRDVFAQFHDIFDRTPRPIVYPGIGRMWNLGFPGFETKP